MAAKVVIKAGDLVKDIRAGLTEAQIMEKYKLSPIGIQSAFNKLVEAGVMAAGEVYGRSEGLVDTVAIDQVRGESREYIEVILQICEVSNPHIKGSIRDISERGVGVRGIEAERDDKKTFLLSLDRFFSIGPLVFEAVCKWSRRDEESEDCIAGFEITKIDEQTLLELRELLRLVSFKEGY